MDSLSALLILAGYLIGSIPFGFLIARARGVDILHQGSGNIGATNVTRVLGPRLGLLVFLLDFTKGALPVLAARFLDATGDALAVCAGVAAFVGHMFPLFLHFRGGKGVATGAGVLAVLLPLPLLGSLYLWLVVLLATRYVSLASVTAAAFLVAERLAFSPEPLGSHHWVVTLFCILAALLVAVRHQANLRRLWLGNENQLSEGPMMLGLSKSLHVLALGTCLGAQVFFTILGLVVFPSFEELSAKGPDERPSWFPLPAEYGKPLPQEAVQYFGKGRFNDARLEQGSRAAGAVVAPLFVWYYGLQSGCVLLALACAWSWPRLAPGQRVHRLRRALLVIAVVLLAIGWWLDGVVHNLRGPRNDKIEQMLQSPDPTPPQIETAHAARAAFGMWHGLALLQNFAATLVVAVSLALAARMPEATPSNSRAHHGAVERRSGFLA